MDRRKFLLAGTMAGFARADSRLDFTDYHPDFRVEAQRESPRVRVFDLRHLKEWRTENHEFFVFHQTKTPVLGDFRQWTLDITGCVETPLRLSFAELQNRPSVELPCTFECSGNSGHPQLMNGLVSNAVWRGPALAPLLRDCRLKAEAREVVFFGADGERERQWPARGEEMYMPHGRSIFVQDALESGAILATQMNGKPLPPEHGHPVRLIVPGWYGMTQVKWLNRIVVLDRRYEGRHMTRNYHSIRSDASGFPIETSISRMRVKSVTARVVRDSTSYSIHGAAWSGSEPVHKVEVRVDNGPWREAQLRSKRARWVWVLWSIDWPDATPGEHAIVSRATDGAGHVQPERQQWENEFSSMREDNSQWVRHVLVR